ncbi:unnamed protein product [Mycena citricolor]|uniref:Uncharacterized protein n=1 Tax=Mycena citricolor TaxID=2018698 RepID=A0AAD2K4P2_9AGAR|nr:unnamed protein product [Mycena citricolor]
MRKCTTHCLLHRTATPALHRATSLNRSLIHPSISSKKDDPAPPAHGSGHPSARRAAPDALRKVAGKKAVCFVCRRTLFSLRQRNIHVGNKGCLRRAIQIGLPVPADLDAEREKHKLDHLLDWKISVSSSISQLQASALSSHTHSKRMASLLQRYQALPYPIPSYTICHPESRDPNHYYRPIVAHIPMSSRAPLPMMPPAVRPYLLAPSIHTGVWPTGCPLFAPKPRLPMHDTAKQLASLVEPESPPCEDAETPAQVWYGQAMPMYEMDQSMIGCLW